MAGRAVAGRPELLLPGQVQADRAAGARRHGRRLSGPPRHDEPHRGPEDHLQANRQEPGGPGAIPGRGPRDRRPGRPQHRSGLQRRQRGRALLHRHGVRRGAGPRAPGRDRRTPGVRAGGRLHPPGGRRAGPRPQPQDDPLRHQALQPPAEPPGHHQDPGHGHGPPQHSRRGGQRRQRPAGPRHGRLPLARTGREEFRVRPPGRHLLAGVYVPLPADRETALRRRDAPRADRQAPDETTPQHRRAAPRRAEGPGRHLPENDGQEARRSLPVGRRGQQAVEQLASAQAQAEARHAAGRVRGGGRGGLPQHQHRHRRHRFVRRPAGDPRGRPAQPDAALADPRRRGRRGGRDRADPASGRVVVGVRGQAQAQGRCRSARCRRESRRGRGIRREAEDRRGVRSRQGGHARPRTGQEAI